MEGSPRSPGRDSCLVIVASVLFRPHSSQRPSPCSEKLLSRSWFGRWAGRGALLSAGPSHTVSYSGNLIHTPHCSVLLDSDDSQSFVLTGLSPEFHAWVSNRLLESPAGYPSGPSKTHPNQKPFSLPAPAPALLLLLFSPLWPVTWVHSASEIWESSRPLPPPPTRPTGISVWVLSSTQYPDTLGYLESVLPLRS